MTWMVNTRFVPAVTPTGPLFTTRTSASTSMLVVSVALLLAGTRSVVPACGGTVAVLLSAPVAVAATVPVVVKVADVPAGRLTVVAMLPVPLVAPQLAPVPAGVHVQVTPVSVAGKVSLTAAPVTALGPALATVIV